MRTPSGPTGTWTSDTTRGESESRHRHKPSARAREIATRNASVTETVEQLVFVVANEAEQCERLLRLMSCQKKFLLLGDTRSIETNALELGTALYRSSDLQCQRQQLVDTIAKHDGSNGGMPEFAQIIASVSIDYGRRLSELHASIKKTTERLCKTKEENRTLIERSLGNISEVIRSTKSGGSPGSFESRESLGGPLPS